MKRASMHAAHDSIGKHIPFFLFVFNSQLITALIAYFVHSFEFIAGITSLAWVTLELHPAVSTPTGAKQRLNVWMLLGGG